MNKAKLTSMTVAELKALAKKKKVVLSSGDKKADIVEALLASEKSSVPARKTAVKRAASPAKAAKTIVKKAAAKKTEKTASLKARTGSTNSASEGAVGGDKRTVSRRLPARSTPVHDWKVPPAAEEPQLAQERISESKYYTGPEVSANAEHGEFPMTYGEDRIVLMTRDPFVVHAYWEATPTRLEREKSWFGWNSRLCIRIYDVTGVQFDGRNAQGFFDQEVFERAGNWYFDLGRPSHSFCADIGLLSPEGRFLTLARSNYVNMPRDGVSDVIDEEWMLMDEEFWKLYGYPYGFKGGVSSPELLELMRRRRMQEITSPGAFSRVRPKRK